MEVYSCEHTKVYSYKPISAPPCMYPLGIWTKRLSSRIAHMYWSLVLCARYCYRYGWKFGIVHSLIQSLQQPQEVSFMILILQMRNQGTQRLGDLPIFNKWQSRDSSSLIQKSEFFIPILYYSEHALKNIKQYTDILVHFSFLKCKQSSIVMLDQKRTVWFSGGNKLV